MSDTYPVRESDVAFRAVEDEMLLVSASQGRIVSVNPVGGFVWEALDGGTTFDSVVSRVAEHYDADIETVREDVAAFLDDLAAKGLLHLSDVPQETE